MTSADQQRVCFRYCEKNYVNSPDRWENEVTAPAMRSN
jgi:hypothetical protein